MTVLYILSICKAEEESGVVPPLTDANTTYDKIGIVGTTVSGRMKQFLLLFDSVTCLIIIAMR